MTGTLERFELTFGSFGHNYTTIDGQRYITWFNPADRKLSGLRPASRVEFEARPAPTILCDIPRVEDHLASAVLLRMGGSL